MQDQPGGWRSNDTAKAFTEYCGYISERLAGEALLHDQRVQFFRVEQGYRGAEAMIGGKVVRFDAAPGLDVGPGEINQVRHHAVLGHHINAAKAAIRELNAAYLTVMLEGGYTDRYLTQAGDDAAKFTEQEAKVIASPPLDFVGINVYKPAFYALVSDEAGGRATSTGA